MKKRLFLLFLLTFSFYLVNCGGGGDILDEEEGEEEYPTFQVVTQGWHFQGRNCLACHNVDLASEKHLLIGGTVFKSADVSNPDDITQACGGNFYLQFVDQYGNIIYDGRNYDDPNSEGHKGKGNIFILKRILQNLNGDFYVRIITQDGTLLAQSYTLHTFTDINRYDPRNNPVDYFNRFSCNTCHTYPNPKGSAPGFIYPNISVNLCK